MSFLAQRFAVSRQLVDLAERFARDHAGKTLVIDEVHRYPDWARELKNIHDLLPDLHVIVTGSSHLDQERGAYPYGQGARTADLHAQIMSALQAVLYQDIPATFGAGAIAGATAAATMQRLIALVMTTEPRRWR